MSTNAEPRADAQRGARESDPGSVAQGPVAAIRDTTEAFRIVVEGSPRSFFYVHDAEGVFTYLSPSVEAVTGRSPEEWKRHYTSYLTDNPINEAVIQKTEDALQHGVASDAYNVEVWHADGRRILLEVYERPMRRDGQIIGVQGVAHDVTERERAARALRESEQRYRTLAESALDSIYIIDPQGVVQYVNRHGASQLGRAPEAICGHSVRELFGAASAGRQAETIAKVFASGESVRVESWVSFPEGERMLDTRLIPLRDAEGRVTSVMGISRDITGRKRVEEALRHSEERLRFCVEHTPAAVAMFDREMRYIVTSRRWLTDYNLGDQNIIGKTHYEVFPETPERWKEIHRRCLAGAVEKCDEDFFVRADGRTEWTRWEIHPWKDDAGAIGGIIMFTEVITERKLAEEARARSEAIYRAAIENAQGVPYQLDHMTGRYVFMGSAIEELLGIRREEVTFARICSMTEEVNITDPAAPPTRDEYHEAYMRGDVERYRSDVKVRRPDGSVRWLSDNALPVRDETTGRVVGSLGILQDITDRKLAEQALRDSLQTSADIVQGMPSGVCIYQYVPPDRLVLLSANPSACRLTGLDVPSFRGMEFNDIWPTARERGVTDAFLNVMRTGAALQTEDLYYRDTRIEGAFRVRAFRLPGSRLAVAFENITERKRAEDDLRRSEERYRAIYNRTPVMLHSIDAQGRLISVSDYWLEVMGYKREEVIGHKSTEFLTEASRRYAEEVVIPQYFRDGYCKDVPYQLVKKNGEVMDVLLSATAERNRTGEHIRSLAVIIDVTRRKQAEAALRDSEERHRTILDQMQEAVVFADENNAIRHINSFACTLLQTTREEAVGQELSEHLPASIRETIPQTLTRFREDPTKEAVVEQVKLGTRELIFRFSPVRGTDGGYRGIIVNIIDVTEQTRIEQLLFETRRLESIGTLAGGIAHDFNNLMATVLGLASHLRSRRRPDHPDYPMLTQIEESAATAGKLAHQLLVYAKGGKILPRVVEFREVLSHAMAVFLPSVLEKTHVDWQTAPELWPVECDATRVEQVIINLCRNAVDAMPSGGRLTIRAENVELAEALYDAKPPLQPGCYVCLSVKDEGCGMDEATLGRVFDPFFTTKEGGYGLGLAAAFGIIRSHGGAISVASKKGAGSEFRVWLPRAEGR